MKLVCKHCASNKWAPHSGWVQDSFIYTSYQCMDCGHRQATRESVKEFNEKLDSQAPVTDLRNLL
jgi:hypothetical protein